MDACSANLGGPFSTTSCVCTERAPLWIIRVSVNPSVRNEIRAQDPSLDEQDSQFP